MTLLCRAAGCSTRTASRYAVHCPRHRVRLRRHGAVEQRGITKAELKPYIELVRAMVAKNAQNIVWDRLDARWQTLVEQARDLLSVRAQGRAGPRYVCAAAEEVLRLASAVEPRSVVETTLAMVMMQEAEPRRFRSDRAFRTQLVRRVRGLTEANVRQHLDRSSGRVKRVYTEVTPRATAVMGQWIAENLGPVGLTLARLKQAETERAQREREEFKQAVSELE